jgi:hypothetical protein
MILFITDNLLPMPPVIQMPGISISKPEYFSPVGGLPGHRATERWTNGRREFTKGAHEQSEP